MRTSPSLCEMTSVTGPIGSFWTADSLREGSIVQVPEKSGLPCACAVEGRASAATRTAGIKHFITASPVEQHTKVNCRWRPTVRRRKPRNHEKHEHEKHEMICFRGFRVFVG